MSKLTRVLLVTVSALFLMGAFVTTASAFPTKTSACTGCHSGVNVPVTATVNSVTATGVIYDISAPTATALAIFQGTTKVAYLYGTAWQYGFAAGKAYTVYAVKGPTTSDGVGKVSFTPVAPPADTTAPVTTSDAVAAYVSTATITLTATDTGGSGVAHTYYILDGGAQTESKTITTSVLGSHTLKFWSVDVAGNVEAQKSVTFSVNAPADTTAPVTTSNAVASYTGTATITLTATDAGGSGVAHTYYILDGGVQLEGTTVTVSSAGAHTLKFWSVDGAGNIELQKSAAFTVVAPDTTAPVTTSNAVASYTSTATITLAATDAGGSGVAHTYYILDAGVQTESKTITTSVLGTHTVEFWSVDGAGNVETPHKTAAFKVVAAPDTTPPVTTSDAVPSYVGTATVLLSATDAGGSGVAHTYYKLDAGAQTESSTITVSSVGTHTVEFWSVDGAGNAETPHKTATFKITAPVVSDKIPPTTTSNAAAYYTTTATITFTAKDNVGGSGVLATYYSLDGATRVTGTVVVVSAPGPHTLEFWSEDKGANEELPHKTASFTIDGVAPTTTSDAVACYAGPAQITLTAKDNANGSGVSATYYKVDGGAQNAGTSIAVGSTGLHAIEFWSVDAAGNAEAPHKTASFMVDPDAPTTTSDAQSGYTTAALIALTASDGTGSGVAHTYYVLDGGATTEGTSVSVSADGAHTLEFWSVDVAGNEEKPHATAAFTIDSGAPVTTSDALPLYTQNATITLSATDGAGSGVDATYYSIDGSAAVEGTLVTVSTVGTHTVEFWSTDKLGNEENPHKSATFRVRPVAVKIGATRIPNVSTITKYRNRNGVATYKLGVKITGPNGVAMPGVVVLLQIRDNTSSPWISIYSLKTGSAGTAYKSFTKRRKYTAYYRWYAPATEAHLSAKTAGQKVIVK